MTEARDASDDAAHSSASCSSPGDRDGASSRCHEGIDFALFSLIADLVNAWYVIFSALTPQAATAKRLDQDNGGGDGPSGADHRKSGKKYPYFRTCSVHIIHTLINHVGLANIYMYVYLDLANLVLVHKRLHMYSIYLYAHVQYSYVRRVQLR